MILFCMWASIRFKNYDIILHFYKTIIWALDAMLQVLFFNVAEAKDEKIILYQLFYKITQKTLDTFRTVESWGSNLNLIIGNFSITRLFEIYIAFQIKHNAEQQNFKTKCKGFLCFIIRCWSIHTYLIINYITCVVFRNNYC